MASLRQAAQAFVAIGGRIYIGPDNVLGAGISYQHLGSLSVPDDERERRKATCRALYDMEEADTASLATLVREYGQPNGKGSIVWQEA